MVAAIASNDRLAIADNQNRVLVYSLDGQQKGTITGRAAEVAPKADLITVRVDNDTIELYDLASLQKRASYAFNNRVSFNGFNGDGTRLLVLTADQQVYILNPNAVDGKQSSVASGDKQPSGALAAR